MICRKCKAMMNESSVICLNCRENDNIERNQDLINNWQFKKVGDLNDAQSLIEVGDQYANISDRENLLRAAEYFDKAARLGDDYELLAAAIRLKKISSRLEESLYIEKALKWLRRAVESTDSEIKLRAAELLYDSYDYNGKLFEEGLDVEKAFFVFRQMASEGYEDAIALCGLCYETGRGLPKNVQKNTKIALTLYKKLDRAQYIINQCKARLMNEGQNLKFEKRFGLPVPYVENTHLHKKEYYLNFDDFRKFEYKERIYYTVGAKYLCSSKTDGTDIKIIAKNTEIEYKNIVVNDTGIYLYKSEIEDEEKFTVLWYDFSGSLIKTIEIHGLVNNVYFYDNIFYYKVLIKKKSENKYDDEICCSLYSFDIASGEKTLIIDGAYIIEKICGTDKYLIYWAKYYRDDLYEQIHDEGWIKYDIETKEHISLDHKYGNPRNVISKPEVYDKDNPLYIEEEKRKILFFDLSREIMWVERCYTENNSYNLHGNHGFCEEMRFLEPKKISPDFDADLENMPIWKTSVTYFHCVNEYFNGIVHYILQENNTYSHLDFASCNMEGKQIFWNDSKYSGFNSFNVSGKHLFLDRYEYGEEQYNLTEECSQALRDSWFEELPEYSLKSLAEKRSKIIEAKFEKQKGLKITSIENTHSHKKEYYANNVDFYKFAYRGRIYYTINEKLCSSAIDGSDVKIIAKNENIQYKNIVVNDTGIYLYKAESYDDGNLYILWYNFYGNLIKTIEMSGSFREVYFYDNTVYYAEFVTERIEHFLYTDDDIYSNYENYNAFDVKSYFNMYSLDISSGKKILIVSEANSIKRICAADKYLIYWVEYQDSQGNISDSGWIKYDIETKEHISLDHKYGNPQNAIKNRTYYDDNYLAYKKEEKREIAFFDPARNIMWVKEPFLSDDFNSSGKYIFLEPKKISSDFNDDVEDMPIWKIRSKDISYSREYFDGILHYVSESYYKFSSYDIEGKENSWNNSLHGECDKFVVSEGYLFLDKDTLGEKQYNLTTVPSKPLRASWFNKLSAEENISDNEDDDNISYESSALSDSQNDNIVSSKENLHVIKTIGYTDIKYNICTFGAKFHIGFGILVKIQINGKIYECKTHTSAKGRVNGMKKLYSENNIELGNVLKASYSAADNIIILEIQ